MAMMSVELLIKSNSSTMCLGAFVGLCMGLDLGHAADLFLAYVYIT